MYGYEGYGMGYSPSNGMRGMGRPPKVHKTTKKDILTFIQNSTGASEIVQVDDFESIMTRHICMGGNTIQILQKMSYPLQTESGVVNIEYFFCNICKKCIVDRNTIEPVGSVSF